MPIICCFIQLVMKIDKSQKVGITEASEISFFLDAFDRLYDANIIITKRLTNELIDIIGKYEKSNKKILCKCKKCGYEWYQLPVNILHGNSCPSCASSKLEDLVKSVLDKNNVKYVEKVSSDIFPWIGKQHLDFYLPDNGLAIECQGEQHFKPVKHFGGYNNFIDTIVRDKKKNDLCKNNGIKILYVIQKEYSKYTNENIILREIYDKSDKVMSDEINNLYCFWR